MTLFTMKWPKSLQFLTNKFKEFKFETAMILNFYDKFILRSDLESKPIKVEKRYIDK